MITLNTNLASMIVQSNLQKSTNALNTVIERMTSGYKINGAKDNTANYSITTNMSSDTSTDKNKFKEIAISTFVESHGWYTKDGYLPMLTPFAKDVNIGLQVGIDSSENSGINLTTSFELFSVGDLRGIGLNNNDYLTQIDKMLNDVSAKQTEYGAVQNRLDSSLEEISTQYENLVSSRSTLRDADIAEISSEYIRQQILHQASATLLATANQSPALALQLI